jgi:hypothetical protein
MMAWSRRCFMTIAFALATAPGLVLAEAAPLPLPSVATLADQAAHRFPQPVRAGALLGRDVLEPIEAQPVLGRLNALVRRDDGGIDAIIEYGGVFGFGARRVAVPIEALALLGEHTALVGYTAAQLNSLPTAPAAAPRIDDAAIIKVGLVKPFH